MLVCVVRLYNNYIWAHTQFQKTRYSLCFFFGFYHCVFDYQFHWVLVFSVSLFCLPYVLLSPTRWQWIIIQIDWSILVFVCDVLRNVFLKSITNKHAKQILISADLVVVCCRHRFYTHAHDSHMCGSIHSAQKLGNAKHIHQQMWWWSPHSTPFHFIPFVEHCGSEMVNDWINCCCFL